MEAKILSQTSYEESYLGRLRKLIGKEKVIIAATRGVIFNEFGNLLLIRRRDNGRWAMPAVSMELDESVYECLVREVAEESGLLVKDATLFAIWSNPAKMSIQTEYGDPYQLVIFIFRVDAWSGEIVQETEETIDAGFFDLNALPEIHCHYLATLEDLSRFESSSKLILK